MTRFFHQNQMFSSEPLHEPHNFQFADIPHLLYSPVLLLRTLLRSSQVRHLSGSAARGGPKRWVSCTGWRKKGERASCGLWLWFSSSGITGLGLGSWLWGTGTGGPVPGSQGPPGGPGELVAPAWTSVGLQVKRPSTQHVPDTTTVMGLPCRTAAPLTPQTTPTDRHVLQSQTGRVWVLIHFDIASASRWSRTDGPSGFG